MVRKPFFLTPCGMFFRRTTKVTSATGAAELLSGIRFLFVFDVSGVYKKVTYDTADTLSVFFSCFMFSAIPDGQTQLVALLCWAYVSLAQLTHEL